MKLRLSEEIDQFNLYRRKPGEPEMTQRQLAELVGMTESRVSDHATGKRWPRGDTLVKYAAALRCPVEQLIFHNSDMPAVA